jgi:hypothetical protein
MYTDLPEALLEMHYYHAFRMLVQDHLGREVLRILKPSTNREAYLGFDQGFARCDLSAAELHRQLREAIASNASTVPAMYVGYFLQYKRPEKVERRRKETPSDFITPYYWFELSLKASKLTGISQHDVSYACPMLFTEDDLHREPNLEDVRVVPISTAPPGYLTAERHFVAFRAKDDLAPEWCSEPMPGRSLSLPEWFRTLRVELMGPTELLEWLQEISRAIPVIREKGGVRHGLPRALTIVELGEMIGGRPANLADQVRQAREKQRQAALDDPGQGI